MANNAPFDWVDPFRLDDQLSDEERMIRDSARAYAQDRLLSRVTDAYLNEHTDPAIFREFGDLGLLGVTIPAEYGGAGSSYVAYGLVAEAMAEIQKSELRSVSLAVQSAAPKISSTAPVSRQ